MQATEKYALERLRGQFEKLSEGGRIGMRAYVVPEKLGRWIPTPEGTPVVLDDFPELRGAVINRRFVFRGEKAAVAVLLQVSLKAGELLRNLRLDGELAKAKYFSEKHVVTLWWSYVIEQAVAGRLPTSSAPRWLWDSSEEITAGLLGWSKTNLEIAYKALERRKMPKEMVEQLEHIYTVQVRDPAGASSEAIGILLESSPLESASNSCLAPRPSTHGPRKESAVERARAQYETISKKHPGVSHRQAYGILVDQKKSGEDLPTQETWCDYLSPSRAKSRPEKA